jgi:hypothetical protein
VAPRSASAKLNLNRPRGADFSPCPNAKPLISADLLGSFGLALGATNPPPRTGQTAPKADGYAWLT